MSSHCHEKPDRWSQLVVEHRLPSHINQLQHPSTSDNRWLKSRKQVFQLVDRDLAPRSRFYLPSEAFDGTFANLSQLSPPTLSRNFEVLYNTYWQSTYGAQYLFGSLRTNMSLYNNISGAIFGGPAINFNTSQVTITSSDGNNTIVTWHLQLF